MVRKITDFKDGTYRVYLENIDENNNIVHTILYTKGKRKFRVDVSLAYLKKFYVLELNPRMAFDMTVIEDGNRFNFQRVYFGRRERRRAAYSKLVAQVLQGEHKSVEGFFQYHEISMHPNTPQEIMYGLLKQAQHENRIDN